MNDAEAIEVGSSKVGKVGSPDRLETRVLGDIAIGIYNPYDEHCKGGARASAYLINHNPLTEGGSLLRCKLRNVAGDYVGDESSLKVYVVGGVCNKRHDEEDREEMGFWRDRVEKLVNKYLPGSDIHVRWLPYGEIRVDTATGEFQVTKNEITPELDDSLADPDARLSQMIRYEDHCGKGT